MSHFATHSADLRHSDYTISIVTYQIERTDMSIGLYLHNNPDASVDDALNALFNLGVDTYITRCLEVSP